jgi:hypothetical protein
VHRTKPQVLPVLNQGRHIVIVIRGVAGQEVTLKIDKNPIPRHDPKARDVFNYWVKRVPQQWSRTICDLARVDGVATRLPGPTRSRLARDVEVAFSLHVLLM